MEQHSRHRLDCDRINWGLLKTTVNAWGRIRSESPIEQASAPRANFEFNLNLVSSLLYLESVLALVHKGGSSWSDSFESLSRRYSGVNHEQSDGSR